MMELTNYFLYSQILVFIALIFDSLSFQFKERKFTLICFAVSSALVSTHYFLLGRMTAGIIVFFSIIRFTTTYFTTNKKWMYLFLSINILALVWTYQSMYDLIIFLGICLNTLAVFQEQNKLMRKIMMVGTSCIIIYNIIIFTPMAILLESVFLTSNIVGYYRHYGQPVKV